MEALSKKAKSGSRLDSCMNVWILLPQLPHHLGLRRFCPTRRVGGLSKWVISKLTSTLNGVLLGVTILISLYRQVLGKLKFDARR